MNYYLSPVKYFSDYYFTTKLGLSQDGKGASTLGNTWKVFTTLTD